MINSNIRSSGRFSNHFFRNMASHFLAIKNNIKYTYSFSEPFKQLGITFFTEGVHTFPSKEILHIHTEDLMDYIEKPDKIIQNNIVMNEEFYQEPRFCFYLKKHFYENLENHTQIIQQNPYKSRYNNNQDVFIHVRLGDIAGIHSYDFHYYDTVLKKIYELNTINKGYISSDSITNPICKKLIQKYHLEIVQTNEVHTIQFGSTCKHIVLSSGTFSWLIGFLSFNNSYVYYPDPVMKFKWHGNIFVFPEWIKILM